MAKELPYFRFTASEWLNDDISLESYELKGLFVDICAFYWFKDCSIDLALINKRFSNAKILLEELIKLNIIKKNQDDSITIKFLDKQFDLLSGKRKKRSEAGRIGGLKRSSNARILLKQKRSYKDNNKDKDKDKRIAKFRLKVLEFRPQYPDLMLKDFFEYWTESGDDDIKCRWEKEKSFAISRRLSTWKKNISKFNNSEQTEIYKPNYVKDD
jgi:hypothetical protein